jgi:deoxyribose-phosphate aldolase
MRRHSGPGVQVKAAGGIRDLAGVLRCRELGISRVGASATQSILDEYRQQLGLPSLNVSTAVVSDGY